MNKELMEMLREKRPHRSATEEAWIEKHIDPLGVDTDGFGNRIIRIGNAPVLWSSHTDTVHHRAGQQAVTVRNGMMQLKHESKHDCLGADDGAGVWLMLEMIRGGTEGLYVFHRGEEWGGLGSSYIAKDTPQLLDGIDYAIALDRAGYRDIITHQFGGRCCSDDFAEALARGIKLGQEPSDGGTFTDTANYVDLVPECSNVSVGYFAQHTSMEEVDVQFLAELRDSLCGFDCDRLPVVRDPSAPDPDDYLELQFNRHYSGTGNRINWRPQPPSDSFIQMVAEYPEIAAEMMQDYGITADDFAQAVYDETGHADLYPDDIREAIQ